MQQALRSNVTFIHEQFDESVEETVTAAMAEVEAHVAHIFTTLGLHTDDDSNRRVRAVVTLLRSTVP